MKVLLIAAMALAAGSAWFVARRRRRAAGWGEGESTQEQGPTEETSTAAGS